jgi:hypothetical protein
VARITELFSRPRQQIATGSKVLVCSLDSRFGDVFEADREVYARHFRSVDACLFSGIQELMKGLDKGYDIVHLFCPIAAGGLVTDSNNENLLGSD